MNSLKLKKILFIEDKQYSFQFQTTHINEI